MSFIWPWMLLFVVVLTPLLIVLYSLIQRRRQKLRTQYSHLNLVQISTGEHLGLRRHIPPAIYLLAFIILMCALARPEMTVSLPRVEGTIILAFDISGSMAAEDMEPTRMEAAKAAARDFVEQQPDSMLIGVVAFSDSGFAVQSPTQDKAAILAAIDRLKPERGTSLANGILASLNAIAANDDEAPRLYTNLTPDPNITPTPLPEGVYTPAVVVLLTDGENNLFPDPLEMAQAAADRGVRIYTIGIGSTEGIPLEVEGFTVHTQLDEATLQQISQQTNGIYYNAQNEEDLHAIYDNLDPELIIKPEKIETTSVFTGISILILLIGAMLSLAWFGRFP